MADENEIMLELSIGGIFAKPNRNVTESMERDKQIDRSKCNGIQANRRRKREEKAKKLGDFGSCGSVSGPFVENMEWLEAQIMGQGDESACKKEKIGNMQEKVCSGLSASVEDNKNFVLRPTACRSFKPYEGNMNLKANEDGLDSGGGRFYCKMKSNDCVSSAYSDGQCSSHQVGASDDSRSNSSNSQLDHQPPSTSTSVEPSDQHQPTGSTTKLTDSTTNPHESSVSNPPSKPEPYSQHQQASLLARMPCVSTTGNGPNGKKVSGFLYRYTKKEVSIVCVCHGRSFSPAEFVEHAGGVNVANPLKHITIFPAAFAS